MTPDNPVPDDDVTTVHELAGAYALDALPGDEVAIFEAHLATCPDCAEEVASMQAVAADLASLAPEAPPRELRSAVLTAITDLEQVPAATATPTGRPPRADGPSTTVGGPARTTDSATRGTTMPPATATPATATTGETATSLPDNVVSLDDHRRLRSTSRIATGVAAALALVIGGLGLWANDLSDQVRDQDQAIEQVAAVLNAPDARLEKAAGSSLILSTELEQAVFAAGSITSPSDSEVLQMWVIDDDGATSAGLVEDPTQPDLLDVPVPAGAAVGVTVEPAGGSDQPTSDPVVVFQT